MHRTVAAALLGASALVLSGCAETLTAMATVSDQQSGAYYPDEHYVDWMRDGPCGAEASYGHVNNTTYVRLRNIGSVGGWFDVVWSSGLMNEAWLEPGETSQFFYMTPSVWPSEYGMKCGSRSRVKPAELERKPVTARSKDKRSK
ncbi:MAG TPA: hypothetical protein VD929_03740 [Caulobacteraceae bacterium]|nr:hypothetical protein [Caulobacteraceae bacterium]